MPHSDGTLTAQATGKAYLSTYAFEHTFPFSGQIAGRGNGKWQLWDDSNSDDYTFRLSNPGYASYVATTADYVTRTHAAPAVYYLTNCSLILAGP
jgi:hypothetical protein